MKIAYIISQGTGGLPHYAAGLANAVAEYEDVTVLKPTATSADDAFTDDVNVIDAFRPLNVSIPDLYRLRFNPVETLRSVLSYRNMRYLSRLDPDIVHDPMGLFAHIKFFAYWYGIGDQFPFVVTYHELSPDRYPLSHPPMFVSHLIKDAVPDVPLDAGVVHTTGQESLLRLSDYRPETIEVIPHGTNDMFTQYAYEHRSEEENCLLFFGNVIREKGIDVLIESIPLVKRQVPDVKLVIAGDGSLSERSRQIIEAHPENFELHNYFVPNEKVGELFSRAQLVALPYRRRGGSKGHSGVLSTAFAFGKPVVATTAGDFPKLVGDEHCGVVVPPDDPEELAAGIVRLLTDDDRRAEMARNSSQMGERLSWDAVAREHLELYEDVLASDGRRSADGDASTGRLNRLFGSH